jgi:carbamoyltransferase
VALVLGISPSSHDSSACVFRDGELAAAVAEERMSRVKSEGGFPQRAIDEALRIARASRSDVTHIALNYGLFPEHYFRGATWGKEIERSFSRWRRRTLGMQPKGLYWANNLLMALRRRGKPFAPHFRTGLFKTQQGFSRHAEVAFFDHHESHAAAAAFHSGFDPATVVTVDGVGDLEIHQTTRALRGGTLQLFEVNDRKGASAANFYMHITELLGFRPLRHEGKVLGLAAFASGDPLRAEFAAALRLDAAGRLDSDFVGRERPEPERKEYLRRVMDGFSREIVAAAAQETFEAAVLPIIRRAVAATGSRRVALNGGAFANVKLNQRIAALPEVENVFVFPAMSDAGNCIGAALLMLEAITPGFWRERAHALRDVYLGASYADGEIQAELDWRGLKYERLDDDALVERTAQAIHKGVVVGWFQGRMEFGPRALGNRSMIARATEAGINKSLNDRLDRTEFMPFAPSALAEYADELFENVEPGRHTAEFMTITYDVKKHWRDRIPAVVHVDGTARPQLVRKDRNPLYWRVIDRYRQLSGIPLVLNTSFNVHEEPIVCQPSEAAQALVDNRIDCLAIGNFWADYQPGKA